MTFSDILLLHGGTQKTPGTQPTYNIHISGDAVATPTPSPSPIPSITPSPTPGGDPTPSPEPTAEATPTATAEATPVVTAEPDPTPIVETTTLFDDVTVVDITDQLNRQRQNSDTELN
jgi:hypothetical protein